MSGSHFPTIGTNRTIPAGAGAFPSVSTPQWYRGNNGRFAQVLLYANDNPGGLGFNIPAAAGTIFVAESTLVNVEGWRRAVLEMKAEAAINIAQIAFSIQNRATDDGTSTNNRAFAFAPGGGGIAVSIGTQDGMDPAASQDVVAPTLMAYLAIVVSVNLSNPAIAGTLRGVQAILNLYRE